MLTRVLAIGMAALMAAGASGVPANAAPKDRQVVLTGTYQAIGLAAPTPDADHDHTKHEHPRVDVLEVDGKQYRIKLPPKKRPVGGSVIRATGSLDGRVLTATDVEVVSAYVPAPAVGVTKVLVILTHWGNQDSVTQTSARAQVFTDDNLWWKDASHGLLSVSGEVTPWIKISTPVGADCYEKAGDALVKARNAAKALGTKYDAANYTRTILYHPAVANCAAGWAHMPGTHVFLNGNMNRRVSIHEQGHNYGLEHAHDYTCKSTTTTFVTLHTDKTKCTYGEYGDGFDAMGGSMAVGHFSGAQKTALGWMASTTGRLFTPVSGTTYSLTPFETDTGRKTAKIVIPNSTRTYWVEWRRPIDQDKALPVGATGGVLVRMTDPAIAGGPLLLDMSPDGSSASAVLPYNSSWTSPENIRISIKAPVGDTLPFRVDGSAGPPAAPTAPRNVTAVAGDESATVKWDRPLTDNGSPVAEFTVQPSGGAAPVKVDGVNTSAKVGGLVNGTSYTFTVTARNAVGTSAPSAPSNAVTPQPAVPTVTLTAPTTAAGTVKIAATATPHPVTKSPIGYVQFFVGDSYAGYDSTAPYELLWDTTDYGYDNGTYSLTAEAVDWNDRVGKSPAKLVTVANPMPTVEITSPAAGAQLTTADTTLSATAAAPTGYTVTSVEFFADGTGSIGVDTEASDGWAAQWYSLPEYYGTRVITAKVTATAADGWRTRTTTSAPVTVTVDNAVPTGTLTSPTAGSTVPAIVPLRATATPLDGSAGIESVEFFANGAWVANGTLSGGAWVAEWDTTKMWATYGPTDITVRVRDREYRTGVSRPTRVTTVEPVPTVSVTAPVDAAVLRTGAPVTITADARPNPDSDVPIWGVSFYDGHNQIGDQDTEAPYSVAWTTTGLTGSHAITAVVQDQYGRTATSTPVDVTFANVPGAPTGVAATFGENAQTTVTWAAPHNGGSPITGYTVTASPGGATVDVPGAAPVPTVVTGLTNGTAYTFTVRARNVLGTGASSARSAAIVPGTKTTATLTAKASTITYGSYATLTGVLRKAETTAPIAGAPVVIEHRRRGTTAWSLGRSAVTSSTGTVTWTTHRPLGHWQYRLRYAGQNPLLPVTSSIRPVYVRIKLVDALSRSTMTYGSTATLSGTVYPNLKGKTVYLQRYYSGAWRTQPVSRVLNTYSRFAFALKPARGTYLYRVYVPATTTLAAVYGPTRKLVVS